MKPLSSEESQILLLIKSDKDQARNFFSRVKNLKWFPIFKEQGFFEPVDIAFGEDGHALFWDKLDYLERVSEQLSPNLELGIELIRIIDSLVQHSIQERSIDNMHIWWYCVKIVKNLPEKTILDHLSPERFGEWLNVWTDPRHFNELTVIDICRKLIPHLLEKDALMSHAEQTLHAITRIKAVPRTRGVSQLDDAVFVCDSYWVQEVLQTHAGVIGTRCSGGFLRDITKTLRAILAYEHRRSYARCGDYYVEVRRVLESGSTTAGISFRNHWYECIIRKAIPDSTDEKDPEKAFSSAFPNLELLETIERVQFEAKDKRRFISKVVELVESKAGSGDRNTTTANVEQVFENLFLDYSHIWIKSLAQSSGDFSRGAQGTMVRALRDILRAKCAMKWENARSVLIGFLEGEWEFPVFKRLSLLMINEYWDSFGDLLELFLEKTPDALESSDYEVELFDILEKHNATFPGSMADKLQMLIDRVPMYYQERGDAAIGYWKHKWLSPLREHPRFAAAYADALRMAGPEIQKPYEPVRSAFRGGIVIHHSPLTASEMLSMPIPELVRYLREFKGADFWAGTFEGKPDRDGLEETLQSAAKENPLFFVSNLKELQEAGYSCLCRIFRGFRDAWKSGQPLEWGLIFDFCLEYLAQDKEKFLALDREAQGGRASPYYIWFVDMVAGLIGDGCREDTHAFEPENFETVEKLFDLMLPLLSGQENPDIQNDVLTYSLNTGLGRTIEAYITFSLRRARLHQTVTNWGPTKYERFFNQIGVEAKAWLGCYLLAVIHLDEAYVKAKIAAFSVSEASNRDWQMFMQGYLMGSNVSDVVYTLMRANYATALDVANFNETVQERLVQHLCIGYLNGAESLKEHNTDGSNSLFRRMLLGSSAFKRPERWFDTVQYLWGQTKRTLKRELGVGDELGAGGKQKVIEFWGWTYENRKLVQDSLAGRYEEFLGKILLFTILLDRIDDVTEAWLSLSAPHLERFSTFVMEYFAKFEDADSIKRIGRVLRRMLEGTTPLYQPEDIQQIVEHIYLKGDKADADFICTTYARRGIHFLKEVWEKHNSA